MPQSSAKKASLPNSTADELLNPVGLIRNGGEMQTEAAYRAAPPTWIVVFNRSTREFGAASFGIDYARGLRALLNERYTLVDQFTQGAKAGYLFRRKD